MSNIDKVVSIAASLMLYWGNACQFESTSQVVGFLVLL